MIPAIFSEFDRADCTFDEVQDDEVEALIELVDDQEAVDSEQSVVDTAHFCSTGCSPQFPSVLAASPAALADEVVAAVAVEDSEVLVEVEEENDWPYLQEIFLLDPDFHLSA